MNIHEMVTQWEGGSMYQVQKSAGNGTRGLSQSAAQSDPPE